MVRVAQAKGLYQNVFAADLNQPLQFEDDSYDAAISSGTFTHGHVGPEPLDEILRVIRSDGMLACTVHFDLWESRGFKAKFEALESSGQIECLEHSEGAYYRDGEPQGWFCVYRKN